MTFVKLIWIDLRIVKDQSSIFYSFVDQSQIHRITSVNQISDAIHKTAPKALCFEYDYPDLAGLAALQQTKRQFTSLPILMLTEYHSEVLAIWSFRTGVRDYLVKPILASELLTRVEAFSKLSGTHCRPVPRQSLMPRPPIPNELGFHSNIYKKRTSLAVSYVETHYEQKIRVDDVAALCRLKTFAFSRTFKKDHGVTFREYLTRFRIQKAKELLQNPNACVTSVALTVGFNDFSYFARMFQRAVGITPSRYLAKHKLCSSLEQTSASLNMEDVV